MINKEKVVNGVGVDVVELDAKGNDKKGRKNNYFNDNGNNPKGRYDEEDIKGHWLVIDEKIDIKHPRIKHANRNEDDTTLLSLPVKPDKENLTPRYKRGFGIVMDDVDFHVLISDIDRVAETSIFGFLVNDEKFIGYDEGEWKVISI